VLLTISIIARWIALVGAIGFTWVVLVRRMRLLGWLSDFMPASIRFGVAPGVPVPNIRRRAAIEALVALAFWTIWRGGNTVAARLDHARLIAMDSTYALTTLIVIDGDLESFHDVKNRVTVELVDTLERVHRRLGVPVLPRDDDDSIRVTMVKCSAELHGNEVGVDSFPDWLGGPIASSRAKVTIYVDAAADVRVVRCVEQ
jgi:hypothetical protein